MVKYTLIIEYLSKGNNFSQVATLCGCSRTTVWQVLQRIDFLNISLDEINEMKEEELRFLLFPERIKKGNGYLISNGFSCGMFATNDITVDGKANLDIKCRSKYNNTEFYGTKKVVYGIYSQNGNIKLSGTGTTNIEHTCPVKFAQANEAKGVYAENDREIPHCPFTVTRQYEEDTTSRLPQN